MYYPDRYARPSTRVIVRLVQIVNWICAIIGALGSIGLGRPSAIFGMLFAVIAGCISHALMEGVLALFDLVDLAAARQFDVERSAIQRPSTSQANQVEAEDLARFQRRT